MKYKVVIAYDGTDYSGWQYQDNAIGIQQIVEEVLEFLRSILVEGEECDSSSKDHDDHKEYDSNSGVDSGSLDILALVEHEHECGHMGCFKYYSTFSFFRVERILLNLYRISITIDVCDL